VTLCGMVTSEKRRTKQSSENLRNPIWLSVLILVVGAVLAAITWLG
jgi:hypothetical protein